MTKNAFYSIFTFFFISIQVNGQFSLSGEIRPRTEYRDGFKTPKQTGDQAAFFTEQRSRLNFDFVDSTYLFRLSLQDVRIWGETNQIFKEELGNSFLNEAWFQFDLFSKWKMKMGRQIISYDNQRYLGALEWAQQGRRHDALLFIHDNKSKKYRLDIGIAMNADDDIPEPQNIQSPSASFFSGNNYKRMYYSWFNKKLTNLEFSILAMNLANQIDMNTVTSRQTFGTYGKSKESMFTYGWDFYYQMGNNGANKVNAYLAGINLTYHANVAPFTVGVELVSGKDDDDTSSDIRHFIPDFGTNHAHNGFMDYFFVGPSNGTVGLTDIYLKTKFKIQKARLILNAHQFLTGSSQRNNNGVKMSSDLGSELDIVFSLPIQKNINFKLGSSFLIASSTMKALRGRDTTFNSWGWMMFTVKPNFTF